MKNDLQIQKDVVAELERDHIVDNGTIGVEVHHGVVKLAGCVSDAGIKHNAENAASGVDGVTTVLMDVDVTAGGSATRPPSRSLGVPRVA